MKAIAFVVFVVVQIIFVPLAIVGLVLVAVNQLIVSKRLGVSATAISVIAARWRMHVFGMRNDVATKKLYAVLPNGSELGLWLVLFPTYLRYKIYPAKQEPGTEGMNDVPVVRTFYFDKLIDKEKGKVEQFVTMGAGYDTRSYGDLRKSHLQFFELDQLNTQKLKIESLQKAGIDFSHVKFADVNFETEKWYKKLEKAGYNPNLRTIFLWEGVTIYLSESDVRKTLQEIKSNSAPGSILITDIYGTRLTSMGGVKITNEMFRFGLDFSTNYAEDLKTFIASENLQLGSFYFMGHHAKKGAIGVVVEILL